MTDYLNTSEKSNHKNKQHHKSIVIRVKVFSLCMLTVMYIMLTSLQYESIIGFIEPT